MENSEQYKKIITCIAALAHEKFIEYASNIVHGEWLSRNRDTAEEKYNLSYDNLSEDAKEKDRIFVQAAIEIYSKNTRVELSYFS
jgi:hypothetical protein